MRAVNLKIFVYFVQLPTTGQLLIISQHRMCCFMREIKLIYFPGFQAKKNRFTFQKPFVRPGWSRTLIKY